MIELRKEGMGFGRERQTDEISPRRQTNSERMVVTPSTKKRISRDLYLVMRRAFVYVGTVSVVP